MQPTEATPPTARRGKSRRHNAAAADTSALETMAAVGAVMAALYLGRSIAIPIAIAVLISFSLGPLVTWLRRHHVGRLPSVVIVVVPALLGLGVLAAVVTAEVGRFVVDIPSYQTNIEQKLDRLDASLPARHMLERGSAFVRGLGTPAAPPAAAPAAPKSRSALPNPPASAAVPVEVRSPQPATVNLLRDVLGPLLDPLAGAALVLLFVLFFLAEREDLRDRIIRLAGARDLHRTTMAMDEAGFRVSRFLLMQTAVNSLVGLIVWLGLMSIGLPNAALWGGVAGILRFIPYLGIVAASLLPVAVAFAVDPGWGMLLRTAGLFVVLELITGNIIEPWLYGSSTGLSPVALVVSAIFWTWLWGPIGLLLATPLTVCIVVVGRYVPQLAFLDVLFGNTAPLKPEESFYQRLLAGDPDEATEQAEECLKTKTLVSFYDEVALPALALAERDLLRGVLDEEHRKSIADGVKLVSENLAAENEHADEGADIVLCVAGRSDLDEAAARLLAQLLEREGYRAVTLSHQSAIHGSLAETHGAKVRAVCLSYLDPQSVPHARYLGRRLRRRLGGVGVIAAFWGAEEPALRPEQMRSEAAADHIVTSLGAAVETVKAGAPGPAAKSVIPDRELHDLVARVSELFPDPLHKSEDSAALNAAAQIASGAVLPRPTNLS